VAGEVTLDGARIDTASEAELTKIRGARIGMVFQDPLNALNPLMTVGRQVAEPLLARGERRADAKAKAVALLSRLGVSDAARGAEAYPHEFSGGMRQRVVMAMALILQPTVLIADEPTTALDVRVQAQVLALLSEVTAERGLAVLLITHDVGIVAGFADRVAVMYSGRIVESGPVEAVFTRPAHPYTSGLMGAVPRLESQDKRLTTIPGAPPTPERRPPGCAFAPRCPIATAECSAEAPPARLLTPTRAVRCFHPAKAGE
jgi:oligopeptide/dipeptide ABC transporter ATP-binding protein